MRNNNYVVASAVLDGRAIRAEFDSHTGRLRILDGGEVRAEWSPPHSWIAIASVAGRSSWGTSPTEFDLLLLINDLASRPQ